MFLIITTLTGVRGYLIVGLVCVSLLIVMPSTFPCAYRPFVCLPGKISTQFFRPLLLKQFFAIKLCILYIVIPYNIYDFWIFLPFYRLPFHFVDFFSMWKLFSLMYSYFCFCSFHFGVNPKKKKIMAETTNMCLPIF